MDRRYGFTIMSLIRHNVPKTMKMSLHAESERPGGPLPVGGGASLRGGGGAPRALATLFDLYFGFICHKKHYCIMLLDSKRPKEHRKLK